MSSRQLDNMGLKFSREILVFSMLEIMEAVATCLITERVYVEGEDKSRRSWIES